MRGDPRIYKAAFYLKVGLGLDAFGERFGREAFSIGHK
jgi:hypothetical protein